MSASADAFHLRQKGSTMKEPGRIEDLRGRSVLLARLPRRLDLGGTSRLVPASEPTLQEGFCGPERHESDQSCATSSPSHSLKVDLPHGPTVGTDPFSARSIASAASRRSVGTIAA